MTFAVRVPEKFAWLIARHVDEGQRVGPGEPLLEFMSPGGVAETIYSEGWGVVAHIEGQRTQHRKFRDVAAGNLGGDDDSNMIRFNGGMGAVYAEGALLCQISLGRDRNSIKSGAPHPSTSRSISNAKAAGHLLPTFG